jgi:hypothetical protein
MPETSCAVKAANPNKGGIYKSMGYFMIDPPIPSIPEINDPMKPIKKMMIIKVRSIV